MNRDYAQAVPELVRAATAVERQVRALEAEGRTRERLRMLGEAIGWLKRARDEVVMAASRDPRWSR